MPYVLLADRTPNLKYLGNFFGNPGRTLLPEIHESQSNDKRASVALGRPMHCFITVHSGADYTSETMRRLG